MNRLHRPLSVLALSLLGAVNVTAAPADTPEPVVQRTTVEDRDVRIEELRVRGQLQRVVVHSKIPGVQPYEIVVREPARDASHERRSSGQRVWRLLSF